MPVFDANVEISTLGGLSDSTTLPVSTHSTGTHNTHTPTFLDFSKHNPQLNLSGSGVFQYLLLSGAQSVKIDVDQDITILGDFRTETDGRFDRSVGSAISAAGYSSADPANQPASVVTVKGMTTNLFKADVTEIHKVDQENTEPNSLTYTLNGLQISQLSPHITTVVGTNTRIVAGKVTEDIEIKNSESTVLQGASSEQYRGLHMKATTGANTDIFTGMRSEFVQMFQFNFTLGAGLIVHLVLKVLQIFGSAAGVFKIENEFVKGKMELLETKIHGVRTRLQGMSGRGGGILLGLWRIPF